MVPARAAVAVPSGSSLINRSAEVDAHRFHSPGFVASHEGLKMRL